MDGVISTHLVLADAGRLQLNNATPSRRAPLVAAVRSGTRSQDLPAVLGWPGSLPVASSSLLEQANHDLLSLGLRGAKPCLGCVMRFCSRRESSDRHLKGAATVEMHV